MNESSKLAGLLKRQLNAAKLNPGQPQRRSLPNGLRIDLLFDPPDTLRLQISRIGVLPSMTEWQTVMSHLGVEPDVRPGRCFIIGKLELIP